VQKAPRLARCTSARLLGGEHIVRGRRHLSRALGYRAQATKGSDEMQVLPRSKAGNSTRLDVRSGCVSHLAANVSQIACTRRARHRAVRGLGT
jgi:hypothetical protein